MAGDRSDAERPAQGSNGFGFIVFPVNAADLRQVHGFQLHGPGVQVADDPIRDLVPFGVWDGQESAEAGQLAGVVLAAVGVEDHDPARLPFVPLSGGSQTGDTFIFSKTGTARPALERFL